MIFFSSFLIIVIYLYSNGHCYTYGKCCLRKRIRDRSVQNAFRLFLFCSTIFSYFIGIFPLPEDQLNACLNLSNNFCPLDAQEVVVHTLSIPILDEYPPEPYLILEVSLRNSAYEVVMCYQADFIVV
jgi:hypothetical protein